MLRELSSQAQWKLKALTYDADRQRFAVGIETAGASTVLRAEIPAQLDAAPTLQNALRSAVVTPVFDAPIGGELVIKKLVLIGSGYASVAELNWATGITLSQAASERYTALADRVTSEERAEQERRAAAQQALESKARLREGAGT